jgi:uncharacterized protein (TIGR02449 family)
MIKSELDQLESHVDSFVKSFQQLTIENNSLRKKMTHLNQERTGFLDKKKKIAEALKATISQLQDEISCQTQ